MCCVRSCDLVALVTLQESVEAAGDVILDLVDYCYHRTTWLIAK